MPNYLSPGVYVEEVQAGSRPIEGVGTAVAAFVGLAEKGPFNAPTLVTNWTQFTGMFGDSWRARTWRTRCMGSSRTAGQLLRRPDRAGRSADGNGNAPGRASCRRRRRPSWGGCGSWRSTRRRSPATSPWR